MASKRLTIITAILACSASGLAAKPALARDFEFSGNLQLSSKKAFSLDGSAAQTLVNGPVKLKISDDGTATLSQAAFSASGNETAAEANAVLTSTVDYLTTSSLSPVAGLPVRLAFSVTKKLLQKNIASQTTQVCPSGGTQEVDSKYNVYSASVTVVIKDSFSRKIGSFTSLISNAQVILSRQFGYCVIAPPAPPVLPSPPTPVPNPILQSAINGEVDFGGMWSKGYNNAITQNATCFDGYQPMQILGTTNLDWPLILCSKPHVAGTNPDFDFGGMYGVGYDSKAKQPIDYNNPITGGQFCPTGYTPVQTYGTYGSDWALWYCYRPHQDGREGAYVFGGAFGQGYNNPATGSGSCGSGFVAPQVLGSSGEDYPVYFCYQNREGVTPVPTPVSNPSPTPTPTPPPSSSVLYTYRSNAIDFGGILGSILGFTSCPDFVSEVGHLSGGQKVSAVTLSCFTTNVVLAELQLNVLIQDNVKAGQVLTFSGQTMNQNACSDVVGAMSGFSSVDNKGQLFVQSSCDYDDNFLNPTAKLKLKITVAKPQ